MEDGYYWETSDDYAPSFGLYLIPVKANVPDNDLILNDSPNWASKPTVPNFGEFYPEFRLFRNSNQPLHPNVPNIGVSISNNVVCFDITLPNDGSPVNYDLLEGKKRRKMRKIGKIWKKSEKVKKIGKIRNFPILFQKFCKFPFFRAPNLDDPRLWGARIFRKSSRDSQRSGCWKNREFHLLCFGFMLRRLATVFDW